MVKICILTSEHHALDSRIFYREAVSLAKNSRHHVVLIAPGSGVRHVCECVEIIPVPRHTNRLERFIVTVFRVLRAALREKADIYHFHDPDLIPGMAVFALMGKRVIYDVHEYYGYSLQTVEWLPNALRRPVAAAVDWMEKKVNRVFSGTVTVNTHMEGLFRPNAKRTVTISNYPLPWFINETRPDHMSVEADDQTILYLGGINMIRGYKLILDTMAIIHRRHPEIICNIFGPADYTGIDRTIPRLDDPAVREIGVRYREIVPFTEVPLLLKRAGVCWLPWQSTRDHELGTPVKLFEYMSSGRPVVCSHLGFVSAIVNELGSGILVPPDDPQAHADALMYLFTHPEEAAQMGARGRKGVVDQFNWVEEEKKLLNFYDEILFAKGAVE